MSDALRDAQRIQHFLNDPVVQGAFAAIEETVFEEWRKAQAPDAREICWKQLQALDQLRRQLKIVVDRGIHVEAVERRDERRKRAGRDPGRQQ